MSKEGTVSEAGVMPVDESRESGMEKSEALVAIFEEYQQDLDSLLDRHLIEGEARHLDADNTKRESLLNLTRKLSVFKEHTKTVSDMLSHGDIDKSLAIILQLINDVESRLAVAPDASFSEEAQIQKYGGKENVPAGSSVNVWEETKLAIVRLRSSMWGVRAALNFLELD